MLKKFKFFVVFEKYFIYIKMFKILHSFLFNENL